MLTVCKRFCRVCRTYSSSYDQGPSDAGTILGSGSMNGSEHQTAGVFENSQSADQEASVHMPDHCLHINPRIFQDNVSRVVHVVPEVND